MPQESYWQQQWVRIARLLLGVRPPRRRGRRRRLSLLQQQWVRITRKLLTEPLKIDSSQAETLEQLNEQDSAPETAGRRRVMREKAGMALPHRRVVG